MSRRESCVSLFILENVITAVQGVNCPKESIAYAS